MFSPPPKENRETFTALTARSVMIDEKREQLMGDLNLLSTEDRVAIDRAFERLAGRTHYEVLAIATDSSWEMIEQAVRDLRKRMDPTRFVGAPSDEYLRRVEQVLRALDQAVEVLGDPVRRFLYDQQVRRGETRRAETPSPLRPATTPVPPRPMGNGPREERASRAPEPPAPAAPADSALVVPAPFRRDSSPGSSVRPSGPRPAHSRPSFVPPPLDVNPRTASGSVAQAPRPTAPISDRRDFDALLVEVERIAVSVQFCIAQVLDPQAARVLALQAAGQALADTRATLAVIQAGRDEEAGRWAEAAVNWLRASRARPTDPMVHARLSECQLRVGDPLAADEAARRALALDPDCDAARAVLSALGRR